MLLVIDANVVISSLITGNIIEFILSDKLELIAPELLFTEIRKNKDEILIKSKFSNEEFEILITILESNIKIILLDDFSDMVSKAEELLKEHIKDIPYIALALKFNCPIWSYEKRFKKMGNIKVLTTSEVVIITQDKN